MSNTEYPLLGTEKLAWALINPDNYPSEADLTAARRRLADKFQAAWLEEVLTPGRR